MMQMPPVDKKGYIRVIRERLKRENEINYVMQLACHTTRCLVYVTVALRRETGSRRRVRWREKQEVGGE